MEKLDINNLIEKAQEFVHNGRLNQAAYGKIPIQKLELNGNTFDVSIIAEAKYSKSNPLPKEGGNYIVKVETGAGEVFTSLGYWNGVEWERLHEASEHRSADPTFKDYKQEVISWREINRNW